MNSIEKEDSLTLEILEAIDENSDVTQRHLAKRTGVALGLANSYLKRCVRKGLVKIKQAPANRYLYYLTPKGFSEKSRLTARYLSYSFSFYRRASESYAELFVECRRRKLARVVLCGVSELAEIALLRAQEGDLDVVAVYDPRSERRRLLGHDVLDTLPAAGGYDVLVVTFLEEPQAACDALMREVRPGCVLAPRILGLKLGDGRETGAARGQI